MSKSKKTVEVKELLEWANTQLARTDEYADIYRYQLHMKSGICTMIEKVLMDTGNYNGYYHLDKDDCEFGTLGYFGRKYF